MLLRIYKKYVQFVRSTKLDDALFFPFLFAKYSLFYQFDYNYNVHGTINKVKYNNQLSIIRISLKLLRATHRQNHKILGITKFFKKPRLKNHYILRIYESLSWLNDSISRVLKIPCPNTESAFFLGMCLLTR